MAVGKKFSIDFQQATEISGNTQILVQPEGQPVEKASVEQLGLALIDENIVPSTGGNYPKMSVGFAENIVGDGSATEEEFSFRPTAGINRNTLNDGAARIHTLKGNSVVWNQSAQVRTDTVTKNGITVTNDGVKSTVIGTAEANTNISLATASIAANHKCLLGGCPSNGSASTFYFSDGLGNRDYGQGVIFTTTGAHSDTWMNFTVAQGTTVDFVIYPALYDLTKMFGAGNEPATVAEFYQRMPIGIDLSEYNVGEIVNGNYKAIKTTGFNQWDEEWENGYYDKTTGVFRSNANYLCSKNPIKVIGGSTYNILSTFPNQIEFCYYDASGNFVGSQIAYNGRKYTIPNGVCSLNFSTYATNYNDQQFCINLSWDEYASLNGTYQPYKPFERDLSWVAKYFPNGMRSAGNVADEIRFNSTEQRWEAVQRVGVVDLGSLEWSAMSSVSSGVKIMRTFFDLKALATNVIGNITSEKYTPSTADDVYLLTSDKTIAAAYHATGNYIAVYDSEYPTAEDVPSFEAAMQGVLLNYELAEPIVTPITENINFDYDVSDYGTEELIVAEGVESAPLSASIEYSPNVLAILKNAPGIANDVDMLKSQLAALKAQLAALTATNNE